MVCQMISFHSLDLDSEELNTFFFYLHYRHTFGDNPQKMQEGSRKVKYLLVQAC